MTILVEQQARERFNRQFEERNSYLEYYDARINVPHRLERSLLRTLINAGRNLKNPQRHLWQKVGPAVQAEQADFDHLEEGWLAPPEEHDLNQAAIAKLNELLQGGHDGS